MPYYAVRVGRLTGIYNDWSSCEAQVKGYSGAEYKRFNTWEQARQYVDDRSEPEYQPVQPAHQLSEPVYQRPSISQPIYQRYSTHQLLVLQPPIMEPSQYTYQPQFPILQPTSLILPAIQHSPIQPLSNEIVTDHPIILYTDGSCKGNGTSTARGGYGIFSPTNPQLTRYGPLPITPLPHTNQRAELTAILIGLQSLPTGCNAEIYTDSKYSINCIINWSVGWERKNWCVKKENLDLIRPIKYVIRDRRLNLKFIHIRGHRGDYGNEEADRLANLGADGLFSQA